MLGQSQRNRDKPSRLPQHQATPYIGNGHASNHLIKPRLQEMEGNLIKEEPKSPALATPQAVPAAPPDDDFEMSDARESSSPASIKRASSTRDDNGKEEQTSAKRQRTATPAQSSPRQPASKVALHSSSPILGERITAVPYTESFFDDEPTRFLMRSIAIALSHVGFDSASKEAMDALLAEANSFAEHFLSYVTESMQGARRAQPILRDFEYSLKKHGLTEHLLHPHLKSPVSRDLTQITLEFGNVSIEDVGLPPILLGEELSGEADKLTKPYIPKKFPAFPSKHTYKSTDQMPERETDPRKIREKATQAARSGEEALRKLVGIGKVSDQKGVKKAMVKSQEKRHKHELWEKAMADLTMGMTNEDKLEGLEQGVLIDAEKKYARQPITRTRG